MNFKGKWICPTQEMGDIAPIFQKKWKTEKNIVKAELLLTSLGVYEATLNGKRVSQYVLAPGWTVYEKRLQYQIYNITNLLAQEENLLQVTVGKGWYRSPMPGWFDNEDKARRTSRTCGLFGEIHLALSDGSKEVIPTDCTWESAESSVRFSEIYDGEIYDASHQPKDWKQVQEFEESTDILIEQEGEEIREKDRFAVKELIITPKGEKVIDFGQIITGYVEFHVKGKEGEQVRILHGEVLDQKGNFYNDNYRRAKAEIHYTCKEGEQTWHPRLTFFSFRYIKLEDFPGEPKLDQFTGIAVYSDMKRTGRIVTSNPKLNQLFSNIIWGQLDNFLDVPTDCPQRDERLGWTGDAQVFVKAASYNFNVEKFFQKWLNDLKADQYENGAVPDIIPDFFKSGVAAIDHKKGVSSAAWGDAATICPWQMYLTYGNKEILRNQFNSMKKWIDFITNITEEQYLWTGSEHYGDWCGLDAPVGSYKGSTREDFIASAYYAYSTRLFVKAGQVLGEDVKEYSKLYQHIVKRFQEYFTDYRTQTEHILAIHFNLAKDVEKTAKELADMLERDGVRLQTGFVGTPYILHALSNHGYSDLAYQLLLREEYPSWLYCVNKGATTIWEHWDGIMESGEFWSANMNSFNHYAYGAVADWMYEEMAGIKIVETYPGFERVLIQPKVTSRLKWIQASIETKHGTLRSSWKWVGDKVCYTIETPVTTEVIIDGRATTVNPGNYVFWS